MRRTLLIASIIIVLAGIGVLVYFFFFANSAGIATTPGGSTSLPIAGQGTQPTTGTPAATVPNTATIVTPRLIKISSGITVPGVAVVAQKAINASSSPSVTVNYIERESGNVFSFDQNSKTITRISNKTLPGIESAAWLPNGAEAFVQYLSGADLSTINTYALSATGTQGFFLSQNLAGIAVSSSSILTLASGVNGSTISLAHTDGSAASTIFSTPLTALRIAFAGKAQYLATTKPTATLAGYAFLVDSTGHFSRIAGPLNGLVALASPLGKFVLVSYAQNSAPAMELIDTATGTVIPLPIATIADKCVWAADDSAVYCGVPINPPRASYPDDWYQGAAHFSDRIWKINVASRYAQLVLDFSQQTKDVIDVESPAIDTNGSTLVFVNKNDGALWSYSL